MICHGSKPHLIQGHTLSDALSAGKYLCKMCADISGKEVIAKTLPVAPKTIYEPSTHEQKALVAKFLSVDPFRFEPLFLTGRAGTGKSALVDYIKTQIKTGLAVVAPTGVAALNVEGQTIHSFFGIRPEMIAPEEIAPRKDKRDLLNAVTHLIVDEVSMCRPELVDAIDALLRKCKRSRLPFGGAKVLFVGDLYQLPPVVKDDEFEILSKMGYAGAQFFDAKVFIGAPLDVCALTVNFRQSDAVFIETLNNIREGLDIDASIATLNDVCQITSNPDAVTLVTTNSKADNINAKRLTQVQGQSKVFTAKITGDFPVRNCPTPEHLELKVGARVMFTYACGEAKNGHIGVVKEFTDKNIVVRVNGSDIPVEKVQFETFKYQFTETQGLSKDVDGTMLQFPLKLGWAITIHKSQGQTYQEVNIDMGRGSFATGQTYVALSRCTSLEGMNLLTELKADDVKVDERVKQFMGGGLRAEFGLQ